MAIAPVDSWSWNCLQQAGQIVAVSPGFDYPKSTFIGKLRLGEVEWLEAEITPTYMPTASPAVVKPETVTVLPLLLQGAVKVRVAALVAPPKLLDKVTTSVEVLIAVMVVPAARVTLPAATAIPAVGQA